MEMKKQKFGKQMFVWFLQGPGDLERNFNTWTCWTSLGLKETFLKILGFSEGMGWMKF